MRCCCAVMPAAALYSPSSMGLLKFGARLPHSGPAGVFCLVSLIVRSARNLSGARATRTRGRVLQRADLARGLAERRIDGRDDLLARLEGAQRGDHVGHRAHGVGPRALERAAAD